MIIYERLFPYQNGQLAITMLHPGFAEREYRKATNLYARVFPDSGTRVDVTEVLTLPGEGFSPLPRIFPGNIVVAENGMALMMFRIQERMNPARHVFVGGMDLNTQQIVLEKQDSIQDAGMGGWGAQMAEEPGGVPRLAMSQLLAISADGRLALFGNAMDGVYAVVPDNDLQVMFNPVCDGASLQFASWIDGMWVICPDSVQRKEIRLLDERTGETRQEYRFRRTITDFASARDAGLLAVAQMGGGIDIIDVKTGKQRRFLPHRGANRDDWSSVRLSSDGRFMASKMIMDTSLVITELDNSKSVVLMNLESTRDPAGKSRTLEYVPDFCFREQRLYTLSAGTVTDHGVPDPAGLQSFISEEKHPDFVRPAKFNNKKSLAENLEKFGLARVSEQIARYWSPAYRMTLKRSGKKALPVGCSKLGGMPDLPGDAVWPQRDGMAMGFIAQINLAELARVGRHVSLPDSGLLSVFMRVDREPYPIGDKGDRGSWEVLYHPAELEFERCVMPVVPDEMKEFMEIREAAISFKKGGRVLPAEDSCLLEALQLTAEEKQGYIELIKQVNRDFPENEPAHQFMGHATALQSSDLELACARAHQGKDPYRQETDNKDHRADLQEAMKWSLLLQLDSDERNSNMLWGDAGIYYWSVPQEELKQLMFDNVWGLLQCH